MATEAEIDKGLERARRNAGRIARAKRNLEEIDRNLERITFIQEFICDHPWRIVRAARLEKEKSRLLDRNMDLLLETYQLRIAATVVVLANHRLISGSGAV